MNFLIGTACAFAGGMLLAVPMGMQINGKWSVFWAIPTALLFFTGLAVCAGLFFGPRS